MANPITTIGASVREWFSNIVEFLGIFYATVFAALKMRTRGARVVGRVLLNQIRFTGVHALVPVMIASLAIGGLVIMQAANFLEGFVNVPRVACAILVKEIIPLLTALILIGRSGTAIAIEIGNMKLNEELAAILKMGIPIEHLVFLPRLLGMVLSFGGLAVFANIAAILGGYYLAKFVGVVPITFNLIELVNGVQVGDVVSAALKVFIFGVIIALTSIQYGLRVKRSVREVPIVTTGAVVRSMIACLILNTFISAYA
jgi:phospholipid/cholesterol/gamma-HCH transport system permease protein